MAEKQDKKRIHALVSGVVQGVGYRASLWREADHRGVAGWVRNLPDGRVELEAEGPSAAVDALLAWCAAGPPGAKVSGVEVTAAELQAEARGFVIRRS